MYRDLVALSLHVTDLHVVQVYYMLQVYMCKSLATISHFDSPPSLRTPALRYYSVQQIVRTVHEHDNTYIYIPESPVRRTAGSSRDVIPSEGNEAML